VKLEVETGGRLRQIELTRQGDRLECRIDGNLIEADVSEISPGTYSFLIGGRSIEARVEPQGSSLRIAAAGREFSASVSDPRRYRKSGGGRLAEGRQNVIAPMPGKVIRMLIKNGDAVAAGQGIVVVEAMKMQNEVKSPKAGRVEKLIVAEGQAVNAGDILAIVV
jgi:biotin carboxyl carrier protein